MFYRDNLLSTMLYGFILFIFALIPFYSFSEKGFMIGSNKNPNMIPWTKVSAIEVGFELVEQKDNDATEGKTNKKDLSFIFSVITGTESINLNSLDIFEHIDRSKDIFLLAKNAGVAINTKEITPEILGELHSRLNMDQNIPSNSQAARDYMRLKKYQRILEDIEKIKA